MSTYIHELSKVFPWCVTYIRADVSLMVRLLVSPERYVNNPQTPNGSSFAVTVDARDGLWNLWLSESSKDYLVKHLSHVEQNLMETAHDIDPNN